MAKRGRPPVEVTLTGTERRQLESWARRHSTAQNLARRCKIILACAEPEMTAQQIADEVGFGALTVTKWRKRFAEKRLDGLLDEPRPGAVRTLPTTGSTAHASNWAGASGVTGWCSGNMQDNSTMSWRGSTGITGNMRTAVNNAMTSDVAPTDINLQSESPSANWQTDVVLYNQNYDSHAGDCSGTKYYWHGSTGAPTGAVIISGLAECTTTSGASGGRCQRFNVHFDQSYTPSQASTHATASPVTRSVTHSGSFMGRVPRASPPVRYTPSIPVTR